MSRALVFLAEGFEEIEGLTVVDLLRRAGIETQTVAVTGSVEVTAPMPGKILSVKANPGQAVKKGEVILLLEAMKMENEVVAPQDGTIASVNVSSGDMVESGDVLATMD